MTQRDHSGPEIDDTNTDTSRDLRRERLKRDVCQASSDVLRLLRTRALVAVNLLKVCARLDNGWRGSAYLS